MTPTHKAVLALVQTIETKRGHGLALHALQPAAAKAAHELVKLGQLMLTSGHLFTV